MEVIELTKENRYWEHLIKYAKNCTWKAGPYLAKEMINNKFISWERVFIAIENNKISAFVNSHKKNVYLILHTHHL